MSIFRIALIGAVVFLMSLGTAQANVVYNWQPLRGGDNFDVVGGKLVFSDNAYRAGSAKVSYDTLDMESSGFPNSPIVQLTLDLVSDGGSVGSSIFPRKYDPGSYRLDADVDLLDGGLLSGDLDVLTFETQYLMSAGNDGLWNIAGVGSDAFIGGPCGSGELCSGATGEWQLDPSTVPGKVTAVPAPPIWPLFLMAVAGLFVVNARRTRRAPSLCSMRI